MKRKFLTSFALLPLLLVLAGVAVAQVDSQSKISITADAAITGYRSFRQGDRLVVLILAPASPATSTNLQAGGFEDLQVTQQGQDLAISFRLPAGESAVVKQKGNLVEITIHASPQHSIAGNQANGSGGGDVQPGTETEPPMNGGTSFADGNGSATKTAAQPESGGTTPAPISSKDAIQQDNKVAILNDEDLAVPESPAFAVLGLTPQTVIRPATPKEFVSSLLNGVDEHGNFQSGIALDAVPFLIFGGDSISLYDYNHSYLTRLLSRTQTSIATAKGVGDKDKAVRLALGLHMTLWDRGDPRTDNKLFECYNEVEQQINKDVVDFITGREGGVKRPEFPTFLAEQKARFTKVTDECDAKARERNWKSSALVIGAAPSWISPTGASDKFRWNGGGVWASLAYGFEGISGLERNSQLIFHARFRSNEQVPDPAKAGNFITQKSSYFGSRLRLGNPDTNLSFEGVYISLKRPGESRDNTYRYMVGLERRLAQNIWFQLSFGKDSGRRDDKNKAFIKGTFNWGVVKKQDASSPTVATFQPKP